MKQTTTKIPKGYKQSELGVIPEDWEVKKLGEVGNCIRGVSYNGERDLSSHDTDTTVRLLRSNNVQNGTIDFSELQFVNCSRVKPIQGLQKNDIVICMANGSKQLVGKSAIFNVLNYNKYTFGAFMGCFRTNPNQAVSRFISFTFQTYQYRSYIDVLLSGSSINNLKPSDIESIEIPYPTKEEQTAIATVLSDTDALIERLEKLIAKKKAIKQGAMQQLLSPSAQIMNDKLSIMNKKNNSSLTIHNSSLPRRRLPGFSGEWEVKKLGEIAEIKTGKKNNDDKVEEGLYPFFVRSQQIERINFYSFEGEAILIPGEGNIGSIYHYINGRFDYHQRVYKISNFAEQYSGKFIYLSMSQNFNTHAMKNSVKATVDSLRLPTFQEFEIAFPPTKEEQTAIASILSDMDAEIESLEQKRDKYTMLKQGMMQELLTGKTRLA